jgi:hypothetical protein
VIRPPADQATFSHDSTEREKKAALDRKLVTWTVVLGLGTALLAAGSAISVVVLIRQGSQLKEQGGLMRRQADHLEEQAKHLEASVATMKDTAQRQLRAYVSVEFGEMFAPGDVDPRNSKTADQFWWGPLVVNTGQTPAHDLRYTADFATHPKPIPKGYPPPPRPALDTSDRVTLGAAPSAQTKMIGGAMGNIPPAHEAEWRTGKRVLFLQGTVVYKDVFGSEHTTTFCHAAEWKGVVWRYATGDHNKAD